MMPPIVIIVTCRGRSACDRRCASAESMAAGLLIYMDLGFESVVLCLVAAMHRNSAGGAPRPALSFILGDERRPFFGHHDGRGIGVARGHGRKNR